MNVLHRACTFTRWEKGICIDVFVLTTQTNTANGFFLTVLFRFNFFFSWAREIFFIWNDWLSCNTVLLNTSPWSRVSIVWDEISFRDIQIFSWCITADLFNFESNSAKFDYISLFEIVTFCFVYLRLEDCRRHGFEHHPHLFLRIF
jgi:hypothetical protein